MLQNVEKNHSHVKASFALCGNRNSTRQWIALVISTPNDILEPTMAGFSRENFQSFLWWRVFEDCSMIFAVMIYDPHSITLDWQKMQRSIQQWNISLHTGYSSLKLKKLKENCYTRFVIVIWVGFQWKTTQTAFIKAKIVWHFKTMFLILNMDVPFLVLQTKKCSNSLIIGQMHIPALTLKAGIM